MLPVHIISRDMEFEDFLPVINDLAVVHSVIGSNAIEFRSNNIISETVNNVKLHLEIPDDVKQRLETELPEINKKVVKIESEIQKLKTRMNCDSYHTKSVTTKGLDVAKVTKTIFGNELVSNWNCLFVTVARFAKEIGNTKLCAESMCFV